MMEAFYPCAGGVVSLRQSWEVMVPPIGVESGMVRSSTVQMAPIGYAEAKVLSSSAAFRYSIAEIETGATLSTIFLVDKFGGIRVGEVKGRTMPSSRQVKSSEPIP